LQYDELNDESKVALDELGGKLASEFIANEILRRDLETQWTEDLRQSKGIYDPEVLLKIPKQASKVYPKYTRGKETTLRGKLNNILLPDNDKNWDIEPTLKPNLSKETIREVLDMLTVVKKQKLISQKAENPNLVITKEDEKVTKEELEEAIRQYASARCKKMEVEILDQLIELDYDGIMREVIKSATRYGTGVVRGAFKITKYETDYKETQDGFEAVEVKKDLPDMSFTRLWDWYPDMTTTDIETCDFFWERYIMNVTQLRELADRKDFYGDIIGKYIEEHPKGDANYKQWEIDVESLDKDKIKDINRTGKYEVFFRIGLVDTEILKRIGLNIKETEESKSLIAHIWLLGNKVVKCSLNSIAKNKVPYYVFYFDKDESSIYGKGLPRIIRDTQLTICGAMRATLNNAALTTGSQREVNVDLLDLDEDPEDSNPYKVWKRHGKGMEAQYPAVRPVVFESHITDLLAIIDKAMTLGDLEISIPLWMQSQDTSKEALHQFSAKLSSSTISIKDLAKSFDKCNEGIIRAIYDWNMEYGKNNDVKGDFNVRAKGSYSLIMQELRFQAIVYFTQTLNNEERIYIKTSELLKEKIKMLDLNPDMIRTEEEVEQIKASQVDEEMMQLVKQEIMAKIQDRLAKAKNMEAKAEKTRKEGDLNIIDTLTKTE